MSQDAVEVQIHGGLIHTVEILQVRLPAIGNEMQTPICQAVTEPTQDPTGGDLKHTAHLYVFIPMFSADTPPDTNPADAMDCPNGGRPGELCGTALGNALISAFGFLPEAWKKLPALHAYQIDIPAPVPPPGSFDKDAAERGDKLFSGKAKCSTCHVEPVWTEPGWNLHKASDVCIDDFQANRAPDHAYRTSPLNGLWAHAKGGFYHVGRFATLADVVNHYDTCLGLGLTAGEKSDLVEYLKSLPNPEE